MSTSNFYESLYYERLQEKSAKQRADKAWKEFLYGTELEKIFQAQAQAKKEVKCMIS